MLDQFCGCVTAWTVWKSWFFTPERGGTNLKGGPSCQNTGCPNCGLHVRTLIEDTSHGPGGPGRKIPRQAARVYLAGMVGVSHLPSNGHDLRQLRSSWSSRAQASTISNSAGELMAKSVITFCRHARFTWQAWQAQPSAWGGPSRLPKISKWPCPCRRHIPRHSTHRARGSRRGGALWRS